MKHIKTFDAYVNESAINEADMTNAYDGFIAGSTDGKVAYKFKYIKGRNSVQVENEAFAKLMKETGKPRGYFWVTGLIKKGEWDNNTTEVFESIVTEANASLGSKAKGFTNTIKEWDYFTDADEGGDEKLPEEWHTALKNLNIKADDAIVCFYDAVGSAQDVLDAARKGGLKFAEVEEGEDGGSAGIVFSAKQ